MYVMGSFGVSRMGSLCLGVIVEGLVIFSIFYLFSSCWGFACFKGGMFQNVFSDFNLMSPTDVSKIMNSLKNVAQEIQKHPTRT